MARFSGINELYRTEFLDTLGSYDHWHVFLLSEGSFEANGETVLAGDLYFFAPREPFSRRVLTPVRFFSIHFEDDGAELPRGRVRFRDVARVLSTAELLRKCLLTERDERSICHFLRDLRLQYELEQASVAAQNETVARALALFEKEPQCSVREAAARLHISQTYLIRLFHRELGQTPNAYLKRERVARARALLSDGDLPMQRIAQLCGYANAYYFSTDFKKQTGLSPTSFRKIWRV